MSVELWCGDCRDVMDFVVNDASVDVIVADPPYGDTSLAWDCRVEGWLPRAVCALKPNGSIWVFGSLRSLVPVFVEAQTLGLRYSQDVVWRKQNGTGFHADRFRRVHEHAVLFYRGKWRDVYKCVQHTADATARTVRTKGRPAHTGNLDRVPYVSEDGGPRLQRSVLDVRNEHGKAVHPTQKPLGIVEPLVLYSCPPGGLVFDPFMGSGSVAVAALRHGRDVVGCDVDEGYFALTRKRILATVRGDSDATDDDEGSAGRQGG
jgi:site-specific DNA-methyltransferase (adenine-specific)